MEGGLNPPFPSIRSKQLQNGWERMGTEGTDGVRHKSRRARARGVGPVQSLSRPACKPAVQPSDPKRPEKKVQGWGGGLNFGSLRPTTPHVLARRENFPLLKSIKFQQIMAEHGGRRKGAGRPLGSRNKPRLIHGLPQTGDPVAWLLGAMNNPGFTLRQRVKIASTLMPFMHPPG